MFYMKSSFRILLLLLFPALLQLGASTTYLDPVDEDRGRTVPVKVYLPEAADGPAPVILYSHGLGGSREGKAFLGEHWAESGYVAVFMQHPGSDKSVWENVERAERMKSLKGAASGRNFKLRVGDVVFVLDQLEIWNADPEHPLSGKLDLERIGMAGHSFGAVTTQAIMGQRPMRISKRSFADDRIDCFVPMSPSASTRIPDDKAFGEIGKPVLCMTGTEDTSLIRPEVTADSRLKVYAALPSGDKFQVVFEGGEHRLFSARDKYEKYQPALERLTTEFFDAYLRDSDEARKWLQSEAPLDTLFENDKWEWK